MIGGTNVTAEQVVAMSDEEFETWSKERERRRTMGNSTKTKGGGKAAPAPISMSPKGGGHPVGGMASVKGGGSKGGSKGGRYK